MEKEEYRKRIILLASDLLEQKATKEMFLGAVSPILDEAADDHDVNLNDHGELIFTVDHFYKHGGFV